MRSVEFKYINLKKAYLRLKEVSDMYDGKNDIIRDSLIQRFEFTYELTHKTLKEFMKYLGVTLENSFPRTIYKKAYVNNLISDDQVWINLLEDRNCTSHIYNENLADEVAKRLNDFSLTSVFELDLKPELQIFAEIMFNNPKILKLAYRNVPERTLRYWKAKVREAVRKANDDNVEAIKKALQRDTEKLANELKKYCDIYLGF